HYPFGDHRDGIRWFRRKRHGILSRKTGIRYLHPLQEYCGQKDMDRPSHALPALQKNQRKADKKIPEIKFSFPAAKRRRSSLTGAFTLNRSLRFSQERQRTEDHDHILRRRGES